MKKIVILLTLLLAFVAGAQAESLTLGDKTIHYNIPAGYVAAMDGPYVDVVRLVKMAMPADITIHAMYASEATDKTFRSSPDGAFLDNYILVTYSKQLQNQKLSKDDFKEFREFLNDNQGTLTGQEVMDQINKTIDNLSDGAVQIGAAKPLGCFGESETAISFLVLITQALNLDGQQVAIEQALVSTSLLLDGKMLTINQYQRVEKPEEVTAFKDHSQVVINNMAFGVKSGTDGSGSGVQPDLQENPSGNSFLPIIIVVIIVVVVVGAVVVLRKKKN